MPGAPDDEMIVDAIPIGCAVVMIVFVMSISARDGVGHRRDGCEEDHREADSSSARRTTSRGLDRGMVHRSVCCTSSAISAFLVEKQILNCSRVSKAMAGATVVEHLGPAREKRAAGDLALRVRLGERRRPP